MGLWDIASGVWDLAKTGYKAGEEIAKESGAGEWLGKTFSEAFKTPDRPEVWQRKMSRTEFEVKGSRKVPLDGAGGNGTRPPAWQGPPAPDVEEERYLKKLYPWREDPQGLGYDEREGRPQRGGRGVLYLDEDGTVVEVKRRRMNPLNPRALARAQRRIRGFEKFVRGSFTFENRMMKNRSFFRPRKSLLNLRAKRRRRT